MIVSAQNAPETHGGARILESEVFNAWMAKARKVRAGERVGSVETPRGIVHFVRTGWLARSRQLGDGRRAITAVLLPGDHQLMGDRPSGSADTLTALRPAAVASVPLEEVREGQRRCERLTAWLAAAERRRCAILEEHVVNLGQRNAFERTGHLLCELLVRSGNGRPAEACDFPFTQADLADVLGLSVVHTNRTLQMLRRAGLATAVKGSLKVPDFAALARASGFDGRYLI